MTTKHLTGTLLFFRCPSNNAVLFSRLVDHALGVLQLIDRIES